MRKPHEEQWAEHPLRKGLVCTGNGQGAIIAQVSEERVPLVVAAPDMARALTLAEDVISDVQQGNAVTAADLETAMVVINGARRKAGVIP